MVALVAERVDSTISKVEWLLLRFIVNYKLTYNSHFLPVVRRMVGWVFLVDDDLRLGIQGIHGIRDIRGIRDDGGGGFGNDEVGTYCANLCLD